LAISFISAAFVGVSVAASIIGEQALLLRYSEKEEREKNLGMFRAASGLGGLLSPIIGSAMFAIGDFFAVFLFVGAGYLLICPFIYTRLCASRDQFMQEQERILREEEAEREQLLEK
jgi:MFS family permease